MPAAASRDGPLLVIGLQGATFDIMGPLADKGELPTLARIMEQGAWGQLQSTLPPVSPQAWSSFLTGVGPGRHGVFGFLGSPEGRWYRRPILSSRDIREPTILQIAGEAACRVGAFGLPMTHPPYTVNGVLLSEQHGRPLSFPPDLLASLVSALGDPLDDASRIPDLLTPDKRQFVEHQLKLIETQRRAVHWLMDRELFDLFIAVFTASDRMARFFWKYMDENHPPQPEKWRDLLGDTLFSVYRRLDAVIGELWERIAEHGTLLVLSDHGSGPLWKRFYANRWLRENGYLSVRPIPFRLGAVRQSRQILRVVNGAAKRLGFRQRDLPMEQWRGPIDRTSYDHRLVTDTHRIIDWPKTRAYSGDASECGIFVNVKGREPNGIVEPGRAYGALVDELRHGLLSLVDPENGEAVVTRAWTRDEIYSGPFVERAPDLIVELAGHRYALSPDIFQFRALEPTCLDSGTYRPDGVFLAAGRSIRPGRIAQNAAITDVAPTILHLLGLPIPESMEGRVLEEVFSSGWRTHSPVRTTPFSGSSAGVDGGTLSNQETTQIEAHLRSLGYIG